MWDGRTGGQEDRKMTARLMKRSDATLIRDGGKPLVRKARRRKLMQEAYAGSWIQGCREEEEAYAGSWIQGCREEDDQWEADRWVLTEQLGA